MSGPFEKFGAEVEAAQQQLAAQEAARLEQSRVQATARAALDPKEIERIRREHIGTSIETLFTLQEAEECRSFLGYMAARPQSEYPGSITLTTVLNKDTLPPMAWTLRGQRKLNKARRQQSPPEIWQTRAYAIGVMGVLGNNEHREEVHPKTAYALLLCEDQLLRSGVLRIECQQIRGSDPLEAQENEKLRIGSLQSKGQSMELDQYDATGRYRGRDMEYVEWFDF